MGQDHDSKTLGRYSFTIPSELVDTVDQLIEDTELNRSMVVREAISHWIDHYSKSKSSAIKGNGVAVISYIYNHHDTRVLSDLMKTTHNYEDEIATTSHIHLSHTACYEIIICKGQIQQIKHLGDEIRSIKGINSFYINYATSGIGE